MGPDRTFLSRRGALGTLVGAGLTTLAGSSLMDGSPASAALPPLERPRRVLLGAWVPGPDDATLDLERRLGRRLDVVHWFQGWGVEDSAFDIDRARAVARRGAVPMVTWEPWDYRRGRDQPRFELRRIAAGRHDHYVRSWARSMRRFGKPVWLRFAHEMNGTAYPWSVGVNHNSARDYVRAWRHVVRLFRQEGAHNVRFVWCPVAAGPGSTPVGRCFPGDRFVDLVGMDGYNAGTAADWGGWLSFSEVFGDLYRRVRRLSNRPVVVAETGCAEEGGSKPDWIRHAFLHQLPRRFPGVHAVVWYDERREADWRLESSTAALRAARDAFTSGTFS